MLVNLPKTIPLYYPKQSQGCLNRLYHATERYLSLSNRVAVIRQSHHNFHEAALYSHKRTFSSFAISLLKVTSYATILFPLIALFIRSLGRAKQHYFYDSPDKAVHQSAFIEAFKKNNVQHMQKLYALDPAALNLKLRHPRYGNISLFLAACLEEKIEVLDWLIRIQGRNILTDPHKNEPPLVLAALENKQETVQWLLKHGCNPSTTQDASGTPVFIRACHNPTPEIAWALLENHPHLLHQTNKNGLTAFETVLASLPPGCTTTRTLQWLYQQGAGRGLFIQACKNRNAEQAGKLFDAVGESILQETNEWGMNHFERACYDGNLRLVTTFFDASRGSARKLYVHPQSCKGGVCRFIYQNGCVQESGV